MSAKETFHLQGGELIRQVTFGMNDGVVSIFALLAGIAGAGQDTKTIFITLIAATIAGALSMAAGEFISGKSESDFFSHEIEQERLEIKLCPDIEREEIRKIYAGKGFSGKQLDDIVQKITENDELWVKEMVTDELGTVEIESGYEIKPSIIIFFSFVLGAAFPVLPYLFLQSSAMSGEFIFKIATGVTIGGLFLAGALKHFVTGVNWLRSGIEMLIVGSFAYGISYLLGSLFQIDPSSI